MCKSLEYDGYLPIWTVYIIGSKVFYYMSTLRQKYKECDQNSLIVKVLTKLYRLPSTYAKYDLPE